MRRDFAGIVVGIAGAVLLFALQYLEPRMPHELAVWLVWASVATIVLGVVMFFWPSKKNVSKWRVPRIEMIPHAGLPILLNRPRYQSAELEIVNLGQLEITDCYATIVELSHLRRPVKLGWVCAIPSIQGQPDRIRWLEHQESNAAYEIKIPPIDARSIDLADTLESRILGFNLRSGKFAPSEGPEEDSMPAYTLTIRVDGKIDGKSMKPQSFDGCLYWETRKLSTIVNRQQTNGEFLEEIHERESIPMLVFEKGDWTKSKRLKRAVGLPEKRNPLIAMKKFLGALNNAIMNLKPPKSNGRRKKRTTQ